MWSSESNSYSIIRYEEYDLDKDKMVTTYAFSKIIKAIKNYEELCSNEPVIVDHAITLMKKYGNLTCWEKFLSKIKGEKAVRDSLILYEFGDKTRTLDFYVRGFPVKDVTPEYYTNTKQMNTLKTLISTGVEWIISDDCLKFVEEFSSIDIIAYRKYLKEFLEMK